MESILLVIGKEEKLGRVSRAFIVACASVVIALWGLSPISARAASKPTFVMTSGYALYPPIASKTSATSLALTQALTDIASRNITGIVYGTLGLPPQIAARFVNGFDPNLYNQQLFTQAKSLHANLWLQLRYYDNWLTVGTIKVNLTAPDIINNATNQAIFLKAAMATVAVYAKAYPTACTIILGEEETIYHSEYGGGLFWAGPTLWGSSPTYGVNPQYLFQSTALDQDFASEYVSITKMLMTAIRGKYPTCRIGLHIGSASLYTIIYGVPSYQNMLAYLPPFNFTFFDLYSKNSVDDNTYNNTLTARITLLKQLNQTVYYLAQLHTTNFGNGVGRTPSAAEIDTALASANALGIDGFGYYTKNPGPTICTQAAIVQGYWQDPSNPLNQVATANCNPLEDLNPESPNTASEQMVWQSSPLRWQHGLANILKFQSGSL